MAVHKEKVASDNVLSVGTLVEIQEGGGIHVVRTRLGLVKLRANCGCQLCAKYFGAPEREDTHESKSYRRNAVNHRYRRR